MNFRKLVFTLSLFAFPILLMSQNREALLSKMTAESCSCIKETIPKGAAPEELQMKIGLCFLPLTEKYGDDIKNHLGIDMTKMDGYEKLGETLGMQLSLECPYFLDLLMADMAKEDSFVKEALEGDEEELMAKQVFASGVVQQIDQTAYFSFSMKTDEGLQTFHAIKEFEGLGIIKLGNDLKGKTIEVFAEEMSIYEPRKKAFITVQAIKKIKLI